MNFQKRVNAFVKLGEFLQNCSNQELPKFEEAYHHNHWFTPENVKLVKRKLNIKNVAFLVRSFWRVNRMKAEQRIIVRKRRVVSESCFKQTNSNQAAKKSHPKDSTLYNLLSRFSLFGDVSIYKR